MTVAELKQLPASEPAPFEAVLLVRRISRRTAKNDTGFLTVDLGDRTGAFHTVVFEDTATYLFFDSASAGTVVRVQGRTDYYQGRFSPKLTFVDQVPEEELAGSGLLRNLAETSPEDPEALWEELLAFIEKIGHEKLRAAVRGAIAEVEPAFRTAPAGLSMHHAYRHGLLEHTLHVTRVCEALLNLYPEADRDLALSGALLHDAGKALEYEGGLAARKTRAGILQGHIVLGYRLARRAAMLAKLDEDLLERLEHIILSHQGSREWGAAVMAATPEAVLIAMADNLDAKMGMVQDALRKTPSGEEFSDRMPGLESRVLVTPPRAKPEAEESGE